MKITEIMTSPVKTIRSDATLEYAARLMLENNIGGIPVMEERKMVGIVTESDFSAKEHAIPFSRVYAPQLFGEWMSKEGVEKAYDAARKNTVDKVMSSPVATLGKDANVADAIKLMLDKRIHRVVIAEDDKPIGIVSRSDLLKLIIRDL